MKHALPLSCSVATSTDELKIHSCLRHTAISLQFWYKKSTDYEKEMGIFYDSSMTAWVSQKE